MLLDRDHVQAKVARDTGYGSGVVRLDATDRHELIAAFGECVGGEVLELRTLLPPNAMPLSQSSRLAQISTLPPSSALSQGSGCTGDGPNISETRGKTSKRRARD